MKRGTSSTVGVMRPGLDEKMMSEQGVRLRSLTGNARLRELCRAICDDCVVTSKIQTDTGNCSTWAVAYTS